MKYFKREITQMPTKAIIEINEDYYYYPKNLRSKSQYMLWAFSDCVLIVAILLTCSLIWYGTRFHFLLAIPVGVAFITARIDDVNILTRIKELFAFMFKPNIFKNNNKPNSSQKLLGSKYISEDGIYFTDAGRYVMWNVEPINLSVLSSGAISMLINQMTSVLIQCPDLEIIAMDTARSLDENIAFLKKRIEVETNPAVKKLYEEFLGEPGSHKAHELLHTTYVKRTIN